MKELEELIANHKAGLTTEKEFWGGVVDLALEKEVELQDPEFDLSDANTN